MRHLLFATLLIATSASAQVPAVRPPVGQGEAGDWAYIGRYRADNATLPAPTARRVVFMGDSITQGWATQPFLASGPDLVGRGISGQTAPQMVVRFRTDVVDLMPRVVHIMAGTNDVAGNTGAESDAEIQNYIADMVELAQAHHIGVVLASIPPAADFPWRPTPGVVDRIKGLNGWIKVYAASHHAVYADYWPVLATSAGAMKPEYSKDGVHPNADGYAAMAPIARAAVDRAIRMR